MRPSDSTTGVNTRLTPNFLNEICDWQTGGDFVVSHESPLGIGNSPPAMNVAVSPEIAVRVGWARVRITPARSIARSVAVTFWNAPVMAELVSACPLWENGFVVLKFTTAVP